MLALVLTCTACQSSSTKSVNAHLPEPIHPAASQPAGPSSVLVYIKMSTEQKFGLLAHAIGKRDFARRSNAYDAGNNWWENPLIVYADPPLPRVDVIGQADAQPITGQGEGPNVAVHLTLIPHAEVALRMTPKCDGVKGTITVSVSTVADFFDGGWTEMIRAQNRRLSFSFNTCDPARHVQQIAHEKRAVPAFALERYTRNREKWEPKSNWPQEGEAGDWRTVIYGKDAILDVTGYRYVE